MTEAYIAAVARSPIGRARKGSLVGMRPDDLAAQMVAAALTQLPGLDPDRIDDLLLGTGQPAGEQGFNLARIVAVLLGWDTVPGTTVNRYCSSSLQTTRMAFHAIRAGEGDVFVSAGVESVSRYAAGASDLPTAVNPRFASALAASAERAAAGTPVWRDPRDTGLLPDPYIAMGQTAENVAQLRGVTRDDQDAFAARSQQRAEAAIASGFWAREITPVTLPDGTIVSADDGPRPGVTVEALAALEPVFRPDGTVTAGNCCPLNDGAAALVVVSERIVDELGIRPLARIVATGVSGLSPEIMGLGPVAASRRALDRAGLTIDDMDLVEINEAFAAQVLPSARELGVDPQRLNVHGGAIAVGHPFGMTGARITATLLNGLDAVGGRYGLETMCVGGGQGMAMVIERV
ncbi:acetyl-CoA C-acetyltransferase [Microbacterium telephonicum]|uniref:Acetyl-CoA C-acetyltransferase n=1 Tax=Microbacterium telephonicum TaxID=1714841 RepID=A0A498CA41_9MICO|nr:acetyl-CoA C-acetyltransferase [Microbacterium telephonicum]RLK52595.1 acetyl-CoA C-acetyltransferase [Microbacterium telephonicum]